MTASGASGHPRPCPVGRCGRTARAGHAMCYPCWQACPPVQKQAIWRTWKAWQRDMGDAERMLAYSDALEDGASRVRATLP